jgi:hypothetical protein
MSTDLENLTASFGLVRREFRDEPNSDVHLPKWASTGPSFL